MSHSEARAIRPAPSILRSAVTVASMLLLRAVTAVVLLSMLRSPLKDDIANLRSLASGLNTPESTAAFERFMTTTPGKLATITRTASYGSWFNFYLCRFDGTVQLPTGPVKPSYAVSAARCR